MTPKITDALLTQKLTQAADHALSRTLPRVRQPLTAARYDRYRHNQAKKEGFAGVFGVASQITDAKTDALLTHGTPPQDLCAVFYSAAERCNKKTAHGQGPKVNY